MNILEIKKDFYQFNSFIEPIDLSFNQFLLMGSSPLLVHTGTNVNARELLPQVQKILGNKELEYVFVSHFESDECGGLGVLLERYPTIKIICSEVTARQFSGFGITTDCIVPNAGQIINTKEYQFEFLSYPSEMHLWEGLILFERTQSILFSSDLFIQFGKIDSELLNSDWSKEVNKISLDNIPSLDGLEKMKKQLNDLSVSIIAPGHGSCIKVR